MQKAIALLRQYEENHPDQFGRIYYPADFTRFDRDRPGGHFDKPWDRASKHNRKRRVRYAGKARCREEVSILLHDAAEEQRQAELDDLYFMELDLAYEMSERAMDYGPYYDDHDDVEQDMPDYDDPWEYQTYWVPEIGECIRAWGPN